MSGVQVHDGLLMVGELGHKPRAGHRDGGGTPPGSYHHTVGAGVSRDDPASVGGVEQLPDGPVDWLQLEDDPRGLLQLLGQLLGVRLQLELSHRSQTRTMASDS